MEQNKENQIVQKAFFKVTELKKRCHYYNLSQKGITCSNILNAIDAVDRNQNSSQEKAYLRLNLSINDIGGLGCDFLGLKNWTQLQSLNLSECNIGDKGCLRISRCEWIELDHINLIGNKIGDKGCQYLSKTKWKNLQKIRLNGNKIGLNGCKSLLKSSWNKLKEVYICRGAITSASCKILTQGQWNKLSLTLWGNPIEKDGISTLKQKGWENYCDLNLLDQTGETQ